MSIVYSTEFGRICPTCGNPASQCSCREQNKLSKGNGKVRVGRQTKGRKGKAVTMISGLPLNRDELKKLAGELKKKCGCGGSVKNGAIEIQGDRRDQMTEELKRRGYDVKCSG